MSFFGMTPHVKNIFFKINPLTYEDAVFTVRCRLHWRFFLTLEFIELRRTVSAQFDLKGSKTVFFTQLTSADRPQFFFRIGKMDEIFTAFLETPWGIYPMNPYLLPLTVLEPKIRERDFFDFFDFLGVFCPPAPKWLHP